MPRTQPPSDLADLSLADVARLVAEERLPPVASWDPPHCGSSAMAILRDGRWLHEGRPIQRPEMVRLFSTLLRREPDGSVVLVTPVEKLTIEIEDKPFLAVELKSEGSGPNRQLAFRLNSGDLIVAGPEHLLGVEASPSGPLPVLTVRHGLEARIARPVYYELAALVLEEEPNRPGLWSNGMFFRLDERP